MRTIKQALLVTNFIVLMGGCDRSGPPIDIIVPQGFTGPVWIVENPASGTVIPLIRGRYRVVVPPNGVVRVASLKPFEQWHALTVQYPDGTFIPTDTAADPAPDVVALWSGGCGEGVLNYYVGTRGAAKSFLETPPPPPEDRP
jgi:hypothetical protein